MHYHRHSVKACCNAYALGGGNHYQAYLQAAFAAIVTTEVSIPMPESHLE